MSTTLYPAHKFILYLGRVCPILPTGYLHAAMDKGLLSEIQNSASHSQLLEDTLHWGLSATGHIRRKVMLLSLEGYQDPVAVFTGHSTCSSLSADVSLHTVSHNINH